jgi:hypothetical protein
VTNMSRVSNKGRGTTMHNNNKEKGQRCISIIVHVLVQSYVEPT